MRGVIVIMVGLAIVGFAGRGQAQTDRVVLERTGCLGSCPVYTVEIDRKGVVTFTGKAYVLTRSAKRQVAPSSFRSLISYLERRGFFELRSTYLPGQPGCTRAMTDADSATLSVFDGRRGKTVGFYYGCLGESGDVNPDKAVKKVSKGLLPPAPHDISLLADFAIHVDSVAGTDEWAPVPGGARTKPLHNYVFIGRKRDMLRSKPAFLSNRNFEGVQITYPWAQLEHARDEYDFSAIREDLAFLKSKNKKLWVQLSDVSFSDARTNVPEYLTTDSAYHGGVAKQYSVQGDNDSTAKSAGYVARRWDTAVQAQFQKLLFALGKEFDGKIEGINLPETSMSFGSSSKLFPAGFVPKEYPAAVAVNMKALKIAFPKSIAMQYANFMPGEWRPTEDKLYLGRVYGAAKNANVGVGGPDLMPFKPEQLKSSYPLIRGSASRVPTGIAVQDGNLEEINPNTCKRVTASELRDFALNYLKVDYIFWGTQEPYFSKGVVPTLSGQKKPSSETR